MDAAQIQSLVVNALTWVGFALMCGLAAKAIMPGRDPGGAVVTMVLGSDVNEIARHGVGVGERGE